VLSCMNCGSLGGIVSAERLHITRPRFGVVVGLTALLLSIANSSSLVLLDGGMLFDLPES
jgi:hypothetical protein